jgi:hypothetical protein
MDGGGPSPVTSYISNRRVAPGALTGSPILTGLVVRRACVMTARSYLNLAVSWISGRELRALENGTTLLFGLPGVAVARVDPAVDGGRVVHVVTDDPAAACCPDCGTCRGR